MKYLAGILVTIENEYSECVQSIMDQEHVDYDIFEIRDKPKNHAHDLLYSYFMANSEKYDLLIKIDADMVITDGFLFKNIADTFTENKNLDRLFIPTFDHFVGRNLGGVNVYRNTVRWRKNTNNYYTDRVQIDNSIRQFKKWDVPASNPLIHHCPNPSDFQAFHFGLHRAIKAFQFGNKKRRNQSSHWTIFKEILSNYKHTKARELLLALSAALYVIKHKLNDSYINYDNNETEHIFRMINKHNTSQLERYVNNSIYIHLLSVFGKYSYYIVLVVKNIF